MHCAGGVRLIRFESTLCFDFGNSLAGGTCRPCTSVLTESRRRSDMALSYVIILIAEEPGTSADNVTPTSDPCHALKMIPAQLAIPRRTRMNAASPERTRLGVLRRRNMVHSSGRL
jgi:hypothetical protein